VLVVRCHCAALSSRCHSPGSSEPGSLDPCCDVDHTWAVMPQSLGRLWPSQRDGHDRRRLELPPIRTRSPICKGSGDRANPCPSPRGIRRRSSSVKLPSAGSMRRSVYRPTRRLLHSVGSALLVRRPSRWSANCGGCHLPQCRGHQGNRLATYAAHDPPEHGYSVAGSKSNFSPTTT